MAGEMQQDIQPDTAQIVRHLKRQTARWHELGEPCWLEIRMLRPGGDESPLVLKSRADAAALEAIAGDIAYWNARERNAYTVRNPVRDSVGSSAKDGDILAAFAAFADCDEPQAAQNLLDFVGPRYSYAVTTGTVPHPRPHPYWEFTEPQRDLEAWTQLQKRIAARLGSDRVVCNPSRIMRVAGTVTWPDSKKRDRGYISELVTIREDYTDADQRQPVDFDRLLRAFPETTPQPATGAAGGAFSIDLGPEALDRQQASAAALSGEEWHNNVIRLVASYVSKGLTDVEIHGLTDHLTLTGYTVEQTRAEVQKAIDGARAKGWTPEPRTTFDWDTPTATPSDTQPAAWKVQSAAEFTADFIAPEYVVEGVIQRGRLYTLTAPTGHGKTSAMIYIASHIATGRHVCGQETERGAVLFLAGENPDDVRARVIAASEVYDLDLENTDLHFIAGTFSIRQSLQVLAEEAAKLPNLVMVVIDTFAAYFDGDNENDNAQALNFARMVRSLTALESKPCVVMPAHPIKNATRSNLTPKGGSSLLNEVDGNLTIWNDDNLLTMHWQGKHRGPDFEALQMELEKHETARVHDRHGRLMPTIIAKPVMQLRAMELAGKTVDVETRILQSIDGHPALPLRERAAQMGLSKSALERALQRMVSRKWLRRKGRKFALTDQGQEALEDGLSGVLEVSDDG